MSLLVPLRKPEPRRPPSPDGFLFVVALVVAIEVVFFFARYR